MLKNKKKNLTLLFSFFILFIIINLNSRYNNFNIPVNKNFETDKRTNLKELKTSTIYYEITINDLLTSNTTNMGNWTWARTQPWCTQGSGTSEDPYVIENSTFTNSSLYGAGLSIYNSRRYFIIRNCTFKDAPFGIHLWYATNGTIIKNKMHNNWEGIWAIRSDQNIISENNVTNNGIGIRMWMGCDNINITKNIVSESSYLGIYVDYGHNCLISENIVNDNKANMGIGLYNYSSNNLVVDNTLERNVDGINIGWAYNTTIANNILNENNHTGLYMKLSKNITILGNILEDNNVSGIILESGNNNTITGNVIERNNISGIETMGGFNFNHIYENYFIMNGKHAIEKGSNNDWNSTTIGNYWDNYTGLDPDQDGIGNIPYNISLSPLIQDHLPIVDNEPPFIRIDSPKPGDKFSFNAPRFSVSIIGEDPYSMWYTLDGGLNNYTFTENGKIDQTAWDALPSSTITLKFYARDKPCNIGTSEVSIIKDIEVPNIIINSPSSNEIYGNKAPNFKISIDDPNLDSIWYTLDNNLMILTYEKNGTISQNIWNGFGNGTVTIKFYANDTLGNLGTADINIRKDIISPIITIKNIEENQRFGKKPPSFNVSINEPNLNLTWYSIYNGTQWSQEIIFTELIGNIDKVLWKSLPKGNVTIRFYASDLAGNIGFEEILFIKSYKEILSPTGVVILITVIAISSTVVISGTIVWKKKKFSRKLKEGGKIEDKKIPKIKNIVQKRMILIDNLIQEQKLKEAIKHLNQIREIAQIYGLKYLLANIQEKLDECKKIELDTINSIKKAINDLGRKNLRFQIVEISKKSGVKDEKIIEDIIHEMIKNKEISAKYYPKSDTIVLSLMLFPVLKLKEMKEINLFLSYSTLDSEYFQIPKIVRYLEEYPEIGRVMFWEADSKANIVEYMEKTLRITNVFVLFCSENSMKSASVEGEWHAAYQMNKEGLLKVISVYEDKDHIPRLLWPLSNVKYLKEDFHEFIQTLFRVIME
ncbi:MAG: NosD domain-containing protein [Promethearchaeota archaeon]